MKHNIRTLFEVLNRYLEARRESYGLNLITPMHMELNRMKRELREIQSNQMPLHGKTYVKIEEVLGE